MIRIREISDPDLKARVIAKLAEWRGLAESQVPEWFELDDADFTDLLMELRADEESAVRDDYDYDPRM